jgi:hypothetical protein
MHCLKRLQSELLLVSIFVSLLFGLGQVVQAQNVQVEPVTLKLERVDNTLILSTQVNFELPTAVEDALIKGIAVHFVAEVDVLSARWYWTDRRINSLQRHIRLVYHPLTRRWRLNVSAGELVESEQGVALNQNFDSLQDAMENIRRMTPWRLAEIADLEPDAKYFVNFRFRLDLAQLPRPLQIGTLGQADWQIVFSSKRDFQMDAIK